MCNVFIWILAFAGMTIHLKPRWQVARNAFLNYPDENIWECSFD